MFSYLLKARQGQFLLTGIFVVILGFIFMPFTGILSKISFYVAILFLGFYATKAAVVHTVKEKSPNVDLLMILAAIGAVIINDESEGAMIILRYADDKVLEEYATNKTTKSISEHMAQVPKIAQVLKEKGKVIEVPTELLEVRNIVIVPKGEQIPI